MYCVSQETGIARMRPNAYRKGTGWRSNHAESARAHASGRSSQRRSGIEYCGTQQASAEQEDAHCGRLDVIIAIEHLHEY